MNVKLVANTRRIWIGAWFLAAFALATVNGMKIGDLDDLPPAAASRTLSAVRVKLVEYDALLSGRGADAGRPWERLVLPARQPRPGAAAERPAAAGPAAAALEADIPVLPRLSGIVMQEHSGRRRPVAALLDGRAYAEREGVAAFKVEQITAEGVWLSRNRKRWFLPAPEVHFSLEAPR